MSTVYHFTHSRKTPTSSVVDAVYYNTLDQTMVVVLQGKVYKYNKVSYGNYSIIVNSSSAGSAYNTFVRNHGSLSVALGSVSDVTFQVGAVVNSTEGPVLVQNVGTETPVLSLVSLKPDVAAAPPVQRSHTIYFNDETGVERSYNMDAPGVDECVEVIADLSGALGKTLVPTRVVTHLV